MIYSIVVLELADFEGIGRKMPKGKGVDATVIMEHVHVDM